MKRLISVFFLWIFYCGYSQNQGYAPNLDGSQTFYKTFGNGEPILIINGGPGMNSEGFSSLAQRLSKENTTIIYDQRGTGKSVLKELNSKTITMKGMVEDIESLRKHLKIEKWIVLGHSFGGMLASYYATMYPKRIHKMILSASGGVDLGLTSYISQNINKNLSKMEQDSLAYYTTKIDKGDRSKPTLLGRGRALAPAYLYDKKHIPSLAERLTQGNPVLNQLVWNDLQKIKFDCKPQLKNFHQPVLIIQGKQDVIKPETAEIAHKTLPNSKIILLDKCGHYGWLDAEDDYFEAIFNFLKS